MQKIPAYIVERIRKVLALTRSPVAAEAAAAQARADALLEKYGIDPSLPEERQNILEAGNINPRKPPTGVEERKFSAGPAIPDWQVRLAALISVITDTEALFLSSDSTGMIHFIGNAAALDRAAGFFQDLSVKIETTSLKYKTVVRDLASFREGMVEGIRDRLSEAKAARANKAADGGSAGESTGKNQVVSVPAESADRAKAHARRYREDLYGTVGSRYISNSVEPNSFGLGRIVGRKISIFPEVGD